MRASGRQSVQFSLNSNLISSNHSGKIFLSFGGFLSSMLVECPHCAVKVEIEPEHGSVFECPHCASDFEFKSAPPVEIDYSDHFWGPALNSTYPEHCLDYIAQVDGELPRNRLIEVSVRSDSEIGSVIFLLIGMITIPFLLIWVFVHYVQNSGREYKQFFWIKKRRDYIDPVEKAIITITDYKNGSYPSQVAYLKGSLLVSYISGGSEERTIYDLEINSKHCLRFDSKKQAERCRENIQAAVR